MPELPPPNGFTRAFRRGCAVVTMVVFFGLIGLASFEVIPQPPNMTYAFLLLVAGFIDPGIASGFLDIFKGKLK